MRTREIHVVTSKAELKEVAMQLEAVAEPMALMALAYLSGSREEWADFQALERYGVAPRDAGW